MGSFRFAKLYNFLTPLMYGSSLKSIYFLISTSVIVVFEISKTLLLLAFLVLLRSCLKLSVHGNHIYLKVLNPMNSSGETPRRQKRPMTPSVAVVARRKHGIPVSPFFLRKLHKKHFTLAASSSPVNFLQGLEKSELSARQLAAGLWKFLFMEVPGHGSAAFGYGSVQSSKSELESSRPCLKCSKEEATKWDPGLSKTSNKFNQKFIENKELMGVVSTLPTELLRAQACISKLKAARKSSKKKVKQFLRKLQEESMVWKLRERQKIQTVLDDLNDKLERERRSREKMELLNSKLSQELAEANLSAKQIMKNYEEEKRRREIIEEVCNELAKQIGEDKAKLEELERESMKIRQELEEERNMLQMVEQWREERVQMKLLDAKISFEDKYNQMIQLIAYLQNFLSSRRDELDIKDLMEAELIKQAAESVDIQRVMELSYDFSKSEDIFSIYEELRKQEANETQDYENGLNNNSGLHQLRASAEYNMRFEANNTGETVTLVEDQDSTIPYVRRETLIDSVSQDKNILSAVECSGGTAMVSPRTGGTEVLSVSGRQVKLPTNSIHGIASPCKGEGEIGFRHRESMGQGNSTDVVNPHVTRGMKGCREWPRGIPKTKVKAIPLEARVRTKKSQLQQLLKPKA